MVYNFVLCSMLFGACFSAYAGENGTSPTNSIIEKNFMEISFVDMGDSDRIEEDAEEVTHNLKACFHYRSTNNQDIMDAQIVQQIDVIQSDISKDSNERRNFLEFVKNNVNDGAFQKQVCKDALDKALQRVVEFNKKHAPKYDSLWNSFQDCNGRAVDITASMHDKPLCDAIDQFERIFAVYQLRRSTIFNQIAPELMVMPEIKVTVQDVAGPDPVTQVDDNAFIPANIGRQYKMPTQSTSTVVTPPTSTNTQVSSKSATNITSTETPKAPALCMTRHEPGIFGRFWARVAGLFYSPATIAAGIAAQPAHVALNNNVVTQKPLLWQLGQFIRNCSHRILWIFWLRQE